MYRYMALKHALADARGACLSGIGRRPQLLTTGAWYAVDGLWRSTR
jgi:hypothetical protein